ncbi:MAG TPA: prephenate dehydrogenase/arogenate dehydrogenase family protein [Thermoanaerobaculia bacterium]|jgi:prephenate dehydrogenase
MKRVAVIGLGLIGGSAALALEARGYDRNPESRARANAKGIRTAETLAETVAGAEIVFAAVPTAETSALLQEIASLAPSAILTDAASLKTPVVEAASTLPDGIRFVGGHPMAGSRLYGIEAATAQLFRGRPWILVPTARSDDSAVDVMSELVRSVGSHPVILDAERHDRLMTWVSHLPHAVATSLARAAGARVGEGLRDLAGPGLLETTRIADRRLEFAIELALADPEALANAIDAVCGELAALARSLRRHDDVALRTFFAESASLRRTFEPD